jgi:hypothetical protein
LFLFPSSRLRPQILARVWASRQARASQRHLLPAQVSHGQLDGVRLLPSLWLGLPLVSEALPLLLSQASLVPPVSLGAVVLRRLDSVVLSRPLLASLVRPASLLDSLQAGPRPPASTLRRGDKCHVFGYITDTRVVPRCKALDGVLSETYCMPQCYGLGWRSLPGFTENGWFGRRSGVMKTALRGGLQPVFSQDLVELFFSA